MYSLSVHSEIYRLIYKFENLFDKIFYAHFEICYNHLSIHFFIYNNK